MEAEAWAVLRAAALEPGDPRDLVSSARHRFAAVSAEIPPPDRTAQPQRPVDLDA